MRFNYFLNNNKNNKSVIFFVAFLIAFFLFFSYSFEAKANDWTYSQNFDSLNIGILNGQDNWITVPGFNTFFVQDNFFRSGSKALVANHSYAWTYRTIQPVEQGIFQIYMAVAPIENWQWLDYSFTLSSDPFRGDGLTIGFAKIGNLRGIFANNILVGNFSLGYWHKIAVEYDCRLGRFKVKIDDQNWTDWINFSIPTSSIKAITFISGGSVGNNVYFDDIGPYSETALQDDEPPIISHTSLNPEYFLNSAPIPFYFSAEDNGTGVSKIEATLDDLPISSGDFIDFSQTGKHTIRIVAEDFAGNESVVSIDYRVIYRFSGFLPPVNNDGTGIYKLGRTLPIKFQLKDAKGDFISTADARISAEKISNDIIGLEEIVFSSGNANIDNKFRYDMTSSQYIFNLGTSSLSSGRWRLIVKLDDTTVKTILISLK